MYLGNSNHIRTEHKELHLYCINILYLELFVYPVDKVGYIAVDSWLVPPSTSNPPASVPCKPPYISFFDHQGSATVPLQHTRGINTSG